MITKRDLLVSLFTFSLTALLFTVIPTESRVGYYDPWIDVDDDGKIDMKDVGEVAKAYGSLGDLINKTELLLELQSKIEALYTDMDNHFRNTHYLFVDVEDRVTELEDKFPITTSDIADYSITNAKLADMAIPHWGGAWHAMTSTTSQIFVDMGPKVTLTVSQNCTFLIMFSAEWFVEGGSYVRCRAKITGESFPYGHIALPEHTVPTNSFGWKTHSFMYIHYLTGGPGTYTVKMQWLVDSTGAKVYVNRRTLVVFALP